MYGAPQTIYDPKAGKYLIYWSMMYGDNPDVIYYAYANEDFTDIEGEPKPFFLPTDGKSCIDGDVVYKDGKYYLFYKTEGHGNGIRVATTTDLTSGNWTESPDYKQQTADPVEGAGVFPLIGQDKYILMYDVYTKGRYEFTETTDLENFKLVEADPSLWTSTHVTAQSSLSRPKKPNVLRRLSNKGLVRRFASQLCV